MQAAPEAVAQGTQKLAHRTSPRH